MARNEIKNSKRNFIKKTFYITAGVLTASIFEPYKYVIFASEEPAGEGPWYGIGLDIEKCIGCGTCAKTCKSENDVPKEPFFFRSWVEKYTIFDNNKVNVESPNGGSDGFEQSIPTENIFKSFFVPKMCNHCATSPCEQVCPVGATFMSPEGIVLVDQNYCIGCRYCIQACPYGCRYLHPVKKVADKCTLCYHRIKKDLAPVCMENCPTEARIFGDLRDKKGALYNFLKEHNCQVLKPHLNTNSKLFYNGLNKEVR